MAHPDSSTADNTDKPSPARRSRFVAIGKWLYAVGRFVAVCILSALLIAGFIVGAPWRINAVIGLLLANLIVVPRRLRICFDVLVGVIFVAVVVWVLSPDNDSARWKPYTFDKEQALIEAERMIPPETNAASIYETVFSEHDSGTFDSAVVQFDPYFQTLSGAWSSDEYPKVAKWLDDHERAIGMLLDATRLPAMPVQAARNTVSPRRANAASQRDAALGGGHFALDKQRPRRRAKRCGDRKDSCPRADGWASLPAADRI